MNKGDTHTTTKQEIRRLKAILTFEQYEQIAQRLINTAINGEKDRDAIQAAIYIIDRMEGKIPVETNVTIADRKILSQLLEDELSPHDTNNE